MLFLKCYFIQLCLIFFFASSTIELDIKDLVIVILSQEEGYNAAQAELLKSELKSQANALNKEPPEIILTHTLDLYGAWTIVPLIAYLNRENITGQWYVFCTENTAIRLKKLLNVLQSYDSNSCKNFWIGSALYDKEPTIIHHYAEHSKKFKYPNLASGFALSKHLFKSLVKSSETYISNNNDFAVDAAYEFATFVFNESENTRLTHGPEFCDVSNANCATYPKPFHACDNLRFPQKMYVAVKTCAKYHNERLRYIRRTWAKHAEHIGFYTDKLDEHLSNGIVVLNTTKGHCAKMLAILNHVAPILAEKKLDWLVITDDDTILSLARVMNLLTCYNPANSVAIGERYGYKTYDYLTGGAGVVLSAQLVNRMIEPATCDCPSPNTPDDMYLFGVCFSHLGVKVTHSPLFHQARPTDYSNLATQVPISFHKFLMIDPIQVYKEWFEEDDSFLPDYSKIRHAEL